MGKIKEWVRTHKGATTGITAGLAGLVGLVVWGLQPEEEPVKEEYVYPRCANEHGNGLYKPD